MEHLVISFFFKGKVWNRSTKTSEKLYWSGCQAVEFFALTSPFFWRSRPKIAGYWSCWATFVDLLNIFYIFWYSKGFKMMNLNPSFVFFRSRRRTAKSCSWFRSDSYISASLTPDGLGVELTGRENRRLINSKHVYKTCRAETFLLDMFCFFRCLFL